MNVLINFSTLKSGGGQNVAMNFLFEIHRKKLDNINLFFLVAENTDIHKYLLIKNKYLFYIVSKNPIKRMFFELFKSKIILSESRIDIIYSYFGIGLFTKKIPQVSGSADSNLYFPEINFWSHYHGLARIKKRFIDWYRVYGIKRASAVVFENEALERKSHEIYHLKKTITIKPSINFAFESQEYILPIAIKSNTSIGLFLCGWQYNKDIMMIPEIALQLKKANQKFHFLLTAPLDNSQMHQEFIHLVHLNDVEDMVTVTGQINKNQLASLYAQIDYVFLLSKLESFSNNIIEAWYFCKPLIIADELWSRAICGESAVYVDRDDSLDIANNIIKLETELLYKHQKINQGMEILKIYPTIEERIEREMEFIQNVYKNN